MPTQEHAATGKDEAYPAIYDFFILPYSLGDVLTWSVKMLIRARQAGLDKIDLYLCSDALAPASVQQRNFVTPENYPAHLLELLPAFHCNPLVRNVHIFTDREQFADALARLGRSSHPQVAAAVQRHQATLAHSLVRYDLHQVFHHEITNHGDINAYHAQTGFVPRLASAAVYRQEALSFRKKLGKDTFVVAVQFRMRHADASLDGVDPERDADCLAWSGFLDIARRKFPRVRFLLLGKLQEKPTSVMGLPNVIVPRLLGMSLGHELALIQASDLYLGSTSGFAAMAMFSDVPYCVTKFSNPESYNNVAIPPDAVRLPFGRGDQIVTSAPESPDMLLHHFLPAYRAWLAKNPEAAKDAEAEKADAGLETSQHFALVNRAIAQLRGVPLRSMVRSVSLSAKGEHEAAVGLLDQALREMPEVCACLQNFHLNRAIILSRLQRWEEAREAALQEIAFHPDSLDARHFLNHAGNVLRHLPQA